MRRLIVLASVLVAVILAGSPATAATKPLPVPYNFLPAAVLGGAPDSNAPGTNDWTGNQGTNWQTYDRCSRTTATACSR